MVGGTGYGRPVVSNPRLIHPHILTNPHLTLAFLAQGWDAEADAGGCVQDGNAQVMLVCGCVCVQ